jgi:hypothetical protein
MLVLSVNVGSLVSGARRIDYPGLDYTVYSYVYVFGSCIRGHAAVLCGLTDPPVGEESL